MSYTLEDYDSYLNDEEIQELFAANCIYAINTGDYENRYNDVIIEPENEDCLRFSYHVSREQYCYDCILKPSDDTSGNFTLKVIAYNGQDADGNYLYIKREFKNITCDSDLFEVICHQVYHLLWAEDDNNEYKCWYKAEYINELVVDIEDELYKIEKEINYHDVVVPVITMLMLGKYDWCLNSDIINIIAKNT